MQTTAITMNNFIAIEAAFKKMMGALAELRALGVITNKKDFTCQLSEWLVAILYDGTRAASGIQKHWDIEANGKRLQVKAHAKAETTSARWSPIKYNEDAEIDELVIVVFTQDYKLKEFYKLAWRDALPLIKRQENRHVIYWNHLKDFQIGIDRLPKQELVTLFK